MMDGAAAVWRSLDQPGHDFCLVRARGSGYQLLGTAVFVFEGAPCCLTYRVGADRQWRTRSARVKGWLGGEEVRVGLVVDPGQRWAFNGTHIDAVERCVDVDFAFTPATNLLPIHRLGLSVQESANVSSAWLQFPSLRLTRLDQIYSRIGPSKYSYTVPSLGFASELTVHESGYVTEYPGFWTLEE